MRRNRFVVGMAVTTSVFGLVFACTSGGPRPSPGDFGSDGESDASRPDANRPPADAGLDTSAPPDAGGSDIDGGDPTCHNQKVDLGETDIDCGGTLCEPCADKKKCLKDVDCAGGACVANPADGNALECKTPKCDDGDRDGTETDIDCGGTTCAKCSLGKKCVGTADCASGVCTNSTCACPPDMQVVPKANGGAYCIDRSEVSKGSYNHFLTANIPVNSQIGVCQANGTFSPRQSWPPATIPAGEPTALAYNMSMPVHYVDWCDAYAFCKWNNKQLCGGQDGKPIPIDQLTNAGTDAWYNACATQGANSFPYGNTFDSRCNGDGIVDPAYMDAGSGSAGSIYQFGYDVNYDSNVWRVTVSDISGNFTDYVNQQCAGGVVGVYQMSGNVAEWEDSCGDGDTTPDGGSPAASAAVACRLRGGSYGAHGDSEQLKCGASRLEARIPAQPSAGDEDPLADVGVRCCLY